MISYILRTRTHLFWMLFHVMLGVLSTLTPWVLITWFYLVLISTGPNLIRKTEGTFVPLVLLMAYTTSFELLARMSGTSPFIPYELGKYLFFILLVVGILKGYRRGYIGWLMLILILPAAFFDAAGEATVQNIVFNLIGPVNVALAVVFFRKQWMDKEDFIETLRLMFYPLVSVFAFTVMKTPDLETVEFTLGANFETSGGFGTNQVATAFGLGAFLVFLFLSKKWTLTGYRWLDIVLLLFFIFRGLITFSRGGMIGGALGIFLLLILDRKESGRGKVFKPVKSVLTAIPILLLLVFTFIYANRITGGLLTLRYQGETPGTLSGRKEKTLNVFTSNRLQIFNDDLKLWKTNPVFGVGVGASQYIRDKSKGFLSHVEISRLLSEHGTLGLVYTLILLVLGIKIYQQRQHDTFFMLLLVFYTLALFTTFHSAMRTYLSPLLFGISMMFVSVKENDSSSEQYEG